MHALKVKILFFLLQFSIFFCTTVAFPMEDPKKTEATEIIPKEREIYRKNEAKRAALLLKKLDGRNWLQVELSWELPFVKEENISYYLTKALEAKPDERELIYELIKTAYKLLNHNAYAIIEIVIDEFIQKYERSDSKARSILLARLITKDLRGYPEFIGCLEKAIYKKITEEEKLIPLNLNYETIVLAAQKKISENAGLDDLARIEKSNSNIKI